MAQGVLPFKDEEEERESGMTALAGLPLYPDLVSAMISRHLQVKSRGWTDAQPVLSLLLLNLAGGTCVDDVRRLEEDEGFCRVLRRLERGGMMRRESARRWRRFCGSAIPR